MSAGNGRPVEPFVEELTRREREILALVAQGSSGPEIAQKLMLALSSVRWHLKNLYAKLGANGKRQAVARAMQLGLLPPTAPAAATQPQQAGPVRLPALPIHITRFFGREAEIAQIRTRLADNRLVTLTGEGGVGKTRLALRAAETVAGDFAGGVGFAELAPLSDPARVPQQVAVTLGVREDPERPISETLTTALRDRQVLLVLDNCEHVLETCAQLAHTLLQACPGLRILATSRQSLGIAGESVYRVPSLSFPDSDHLPAFEKMNDFVAVRLFVDRARLVLADYQVTTDNAVHLARICQRLDGIPLAIEMAAARVNLLSAEGLADRLDDALHLLTGGSRTALPRQQTLRATIDWSYALLSLEERRLLQGLSVFSGGCTLAAVEAVCAVDLQASTMLDGLASLVAKSMAHADRRQGSEARYRLLELMRQYAQEKLEEAGGAAEFAARHRDFYAALAETVVPMLHSGERQTWSGKLQAEQDNLRQAIDWSFRSPTHLGTGLGLVVVMNGLWPSRQENLAWLERAIAAGQGRADVPPGPYIAVLATAARWAAPHDSQVAVNWARQAVSMSRGLGLTGRQSLMDNLFNLGMIGMMGAVHLEEAEAMLAPFTEADTILQDLGPDRFPGEQYLSTRASYALLQASMALDEGQFEHARREADKSSRLYEQARNPWGSYLSQICLGSACLSLGRHDEAREHFLTALRLADEVGNPRRKSYVRRWLGTVEFLEGRLGRAEAYCRTSLTQAANSGDDVVIAACLSLAANIHARMDKLASAARMAGASRAVYARLDKRPKDAPSLDQVMPGWQWRSDHDVIRQAFREGHAMGIERALAEALGETPA